MPPNSSDSFVTKSSFVSVTPSHTKTDYEGRPQNESPLCCKPVDCCGRTCCSYISVSLWAVCASYMPVGFVGVSLGSVLQVVLIDLGIERTVAEDGLTLTSMREAFVSSSLYAAAAIAAILTNYILSIGRFKALYLGHAILCVAGIQCAIAEGYWTYVFGRIMLGAGMGILSTVAPVIIVEISPIQKRNAYGALALFMSSGGIILGFLLGAPVSAPPVGEDLITSFDAWYWRFVQFCNTILSLSILIPSVLIGITDTPVMLVLQGREQDAKNVLKKLYINKSDYENALNETKEAAAIKQKVAKANVSICEVLADRGGRDMVFLSSFLLMLHELTGVGVTIVISSKLLLESGISPNFVSYTGIIIGAVQLVSCIPAILLSRKYGTRNMICAGYVICFTAYLPTAICFWAVPNWEGLPFLAFATFLLYNCGYRTGSGSLGVAHIGQGTPAMIRGKVSPIALGFMWLMSFLGIMFAQFIPVDILFTVLLATNGVALIFVFTALKDLRDCSPETSVYFKNKNSRFYVEDAETYV